MLQLLQGKYKPSNLNKTKPFTENKQLKRPNVLILKRIFMECQAHRKASENQKKKNTYPPFHKQLAELTLPSFFKMKNPLYVAEPSSVLDLQQT